MEMHRCIVCGQDTRGRTFTGPTGHNVRIDGRTVRADDLCMDCYLWSHIPEGYRRLEQYVGENATERPPLGVPWLDEHPRRMGGTMFLVGLARRRQKKEAARR